MRSEDTGMNGNDRPCLRLARQARGISRQQLAETAGISAHHLKAVESGSTGTSLQVALALARALGVSIEDAFGSVAPVPPVSARPVTSAGPGGAAAIGFAPGDGITIAGTQPRGSPPQSPDSAGSQLVRPIGPRRPTVVVTGDDPALPLLQVPLSLLDPPQVRGLRKVLSSRWLTDQLASLPGYDLSCCGERIADLQ